MYQIIIYQCVVEIFYNDARCCCYSAAAQKWFEETRLKNGEPAGRTSKSFHALIGKDFPGATQNQLINLGERRIRTVTYVCEA